MLSKGKGVSKKQSHPSNLNMDHQKNADLHGGATDLDRVSSGKTEYVQKKVQGGMKLKKEGCDGIQRLKLSHLLKTCKNEDLLVQTLNMVAEYCPEALQLDGDDMMISLNKMDANLCDLIERGLIQRQ